MSKAPDNPAPGLVARGAQAMTWVAGGSLIVMSLVITAETLLRKLAGVSIGGVQELSAYVFAISSAWAFGWALLRGAHIRVSALRARFGGRGRAVLDLLAWFAFLIVFAAITYRAAGLAWVSYETGARSPTPDRVLLYIPQALWAFGLACTVATALYLGLRVLRERSTRELVPADDIDTELEHLK